MATIIQFPLDRVKSNDDSSMQFNAGDESRLGELELGAASLERESGRAVKSALSLLGDVIILDYPSPSFEPDDIA